MTGGGISTDAIETRPSLFFMSSMMKSVNVYRTGIELDHIDKDKAKRLDTWGLQRHTIVIRWNEVNDEIKLIMRNVAMIQYSLPVKTLQVVPTSYRYVAQKLMSEGVDKIDAAKIKIEPINPNFAEKMSRTPINQHLDIGTEVVMENSIGYDLDKDKHQPERQFLSSNLLKFESKLDHPCIRWYHYGAQDIGSMIRCKFTVQPFPINIGKWKLYELMRMDREKVFCIQIWQFYGLTPTEIVEMILKAIDDWEPSGAAINTPNDGGVTLIDKDKTSAFLKQLLEGVKKAKIEDLTYNEMLKKLPL